MGNITDKMGNITDKMRNITGKLNKISAGMVALALKIGPKILTGVAKFAKVGKVGLAAGSMITYSYLFTWQFAVMIMVLLFVHEYGHIWAMKKCGLKTKGIYFIPLLGAAAVSEEMFKSRRDEAYIAIMGPIFGLALSGVALVIYVYTQNALFAAAAGWMAMVNLFNLLPINPLDGGRVMKSMAFSINSKWGLIFLAIGMLASLIITVWAGIILFAILLVIGPLEFIYEYKMRNDKESINRCVEEIDRFFGEFDENSQYEIKQAAENIKGILLNEKEDSIVRVKTIISLGKKFEKDHNNDNSIDFCMGGLARAISPFLTRFEHMPRMNTRGIVITAIVYVGTILALWGLMTYTSHIPEVDIARKFFMS